MSSALENDPLIGEPVPKIEPMHTLSLASYALGDEQSHAQKLSSVRALFAKDSFHIDPSIKFLP